MLSILLPSRSRPKSCKEAIESARNTAEGEIEVLLYVDDDDPLKHEYENALIGPPKRSGQAMLYLSGLAKGELMFFGSDDFRWKTKGWDRIFEENMPEHRLSVLYPNDIQGAAKGIQPCFSRRYAHETGMYPDIFRHFGPDTWMVDIARRAGTLVHVKDVYIQHTKIQDETHNRARENSDASRAKLLLIEHEPMRQRIAERIKWLCTTAAPR